MAEAVAVARPNELSHIGGHAGAHHQTPWTTTSIAPACVNAISSLVNGLRLPRSLPRPSTLFFVCVTVNYALLTQVCASISLARSLPPTINTEQAARIVWLAVWP